MPIEIHPITEPIQSLKEFAGHYLLIVLGIVTALGLEQWRDRRHKEQRGREALAAIDAEVQANLENLRNVDRSLTIQIDRLKMYEERLGGRSFAVHDLASRSAALRSDIANGPDFGIQLATVQRSAWDAAVATHALEHIAQQQVASYAKAYAGADAAVSLARSFVTGPLIMETMRHIDAYVRQESSDALRFAQGLRELMQVLEILRSNYRKLAEGLQSAFTQPNAS
jgi:hypothetical protein